jgi:tRNA (Thr-GGU) A37 N-methylase
MPNDFVIRPIGQVVSPLTDAANDLRRVFDPRSADRPNPIGLHSARILAIEQAQIRVAGVEAIDGTPLVDIKPVLRRSQNGEAELTE